ncbi:claudin-10-like isoform 2-T2 [Clarias gariepinus]|uniref:claudin-10 isoform X2 n=1 Tax=Clarias gariepinus TaxID=13013 RepID=UPI00234C7934|nr:claudin-10 isoform X2 [Clarias gariepinus]
MRIMLIQVFGFLISTVGWALVCCTVGMDYWRISYIGRQGGSWVIKAAWYWSTLWRACYIDSSDVTNCRDFDTLWVVNPATTSEKGPIQAVRALLLVGMFLGVFAAILSFIGMDCTYIGGKKNTKYKILLGGTLLHFVGGRLGSVFFTRLNDGRILRYYIGTPVFFGLVGSPFIILGSVLYAVTLYKAFTTNRGKDISTSKKYISPKKYKGQKRLQILQNRDNKDDAASTDSRSSSQSSGQVSRSSIILTERDSFV